MMTYWLWYGAQIVGSVRLPIGASEEQVKRTAIGWHDRVPLSEGPLEAPFERRLKLARAEVRTYEGGN